MASLKEVRNRSVSVNSTQQITKAMKMVSAAKLRRSQDAIIQMRPYAKKLSEMIATVSGRTDAGKENTFTQTRPIQKVLIVLVTSDRGLCGAFNANVGKAAIALIQEKYAAQQASGNVQILPLGKKGAEYMGRRGYSLNTEHMEIFGRLNFSNVRTIGEEILAGFASQAYDVVEIVFNEFKNVATQIIRAEQLLPLQENADASAHGARMTAMDKATENAGELIKALKLEYNRSRQAAITTEILEIVGGAEALSA